MPLDTAITARLVSYPSIFNNLIRMLTSEHPIVLDRAPETVKAKIMGSFVWGQQSQRASLSLDYRFGIAYAATDMLCDDPTLDGIIGMGTFE